MADSSPTPNVVTRAYESITLNGCCRNLKRANQTYRSTSNSGVSIGGVGRVQFVAIVAPLNSIEICDDKRRRQ